MKKFNHFLILIICIVGTNLNAAQDLDDDPWSMVPVIVTDNDRFLQAASSGQIDLVRNLLSQGISVNYSDPVGDTALIKAAQNGHEAIVSLLLQAGARVDTASLLGFTALIQAVMGDHARIVSLLLQAGADINHAQVRTGATPLMLAIGNGSSRSVQILLDRGALAPLVKELNQSLKNLYAWQSKKAHAVLAHMGFSIEKLQEGSIQQDLKSFLAEENPRDKSETTEEYQNRLEILLQDFLKIKKYEENRPSFKKTKNQKYALIKLINIENSWKKDFKEQFQLYINNQPNKLADFMFNSSQYSTQLNFTSQVMAALRRPVELCEPLLYDLAKTPQHEIIAQQMMKALKKQVARSVRNKAKIKSVSKVEDID